jgi:hypothetical protein
MEFLNETSDCWVDAKDVTLGQKIGAGAFSNVVGAHLLVYAMDFDGLNMHSPVVCVYVLSQLSDILVIL